MFGSSPFILQEKKKFKVILIESNDFKTKIENVIRLTNDIHTIVSDVRDLIFEEFSKRVQMKNNALKYSLFIYENNEFLELDLLTSFNSALENKPPIIYFSYLNETELKRGKIQLAKEVKEAKMQLEKEVKETKQLEKEEKEKFILDELKCNISTSLNFETIIGKKLSDIIYNASLKLPKPKVFVEEEKKKMEELIKVLQIISSKRFLFLEANKHTIICDIMGMALSFFEIPLFLAEEFLIEPNLEYNKKEGGIERKAYCAIIHKNREHPICLCEAKNPNIEDALLQNADQLRAYCICHEKKIARGIATNGVDWYFTEFLKNGMSLK